MALPIKFAAMAVLLGLFGLLLVGVCTHFALDAHPTSNHASNRNVVSPHAIIGDKEEAIIEALWPEDGQDAMFFMSLNSCVDGCEPSSNDKSSDAPLKVGLLAPPGRMSRLFFSFCSEFVHRMSKKKSGDGQGNATIQWIPTYHLPLTTNEYNYIVRFANVPILLAAGDALQTVLVASSSRPDNGPSISWQDISETTKLLVSWHCQISNMVDEGTVPLVTISMEELEQDSYEQEVLLMEFLKSPSSVEENAMGSVDGSAEELEEQTFDEPLLKETLDDIKSMLKEVNRVVLKELGKGLVTLTKQTIKESLHGIQGCPAQEGLWQPSRPLPQILYSFLKKGNTKADFHLCRGDKTATAACTMLKEARALV